MKDFGRQLSPRLRRVPLAVDGGRANLDPHTLYHSSTVAQARHSCCSRVNTDYLCGSSPSKQSYEH